jgi:DNA-binding response OmpR family regulator
MTRILLIDDNTTFRFLLRRYLERAGHQVLEATEGDEGLRQFRDAPADVVLFDLFMPGKEGLETIRELRQCSGVPIIAITGDGPAYAASMLGLAEKLGANRTLLKPFDLETLLEALHDVLGEPG